jgi:hypothetical protein
MTDYMFDDVGALDETQDQADDIQDWARRIQMSEHVSGLSRRAWLLLLLDQAESLGQTPLSSYATHTIVYLAYALAPVFDITAPDRAVLKTSQAPYFPELRWDLARLIAQGLLDSPALRRGVQPDEAPDAFVCTAAGRRLARRLLASPRLRATTPFLAEVAAAFAGADPDGRESLGLVDSTYGVSLPTGAVIDYGDWDPASEANYSYRTTEAFEAANQRRFPFSARDRVHLYVRYLTRRERRAS